MLVVAPPQQETEVDAAGEASPCPSAGGRTAAGSAHGGDSRLSGCVLQVRGPAAVRSFAPLLIKLTFKAFKVALNGAPPSLSATLR